MVKYVVIFFFLISTQNLCCQERNMTNIFINGEYSLKLNDSIHSVLDILGTPLQIKRYNSVDTLVEKMVFDNSILTFTNDQLSSIFFADASYTLSSGPSIDSEKNDVFRIYSQEKFYIEVFQFDEKNKDYDEMIYVQRKNNPSLEIENILFYLKNNKIKAINVSRNTL